MENRVITLEQILPVMAALGAAGVFFILWAFLLWQRKKQAKRSPSPGPRQPTPARKQTPDFLTRIRDFFFYTEDEKAALQAGKKRPPQPTAPRSGPSSRPASTPPDAVEVLHLWRDVTDGSLIVQIGEQHFRTLTEIRQAGHERRFMAALRELAAIARPGPAEKVAPAPQEAIPQHEQPAIPPEQPPVAQEPPPPAPSLSEPPPVPTEPLGSFFDNVRRAVGVRRAPSERSPELLSVPEQIEAVLQQKLLASPEFAGRSIHIKPSGEGGVRIEVDGKPYEAVADIADDAVRAFVQEAIRDWELRS